MKIGTTIRIGRVGGRFTPAFVQMPGSTIDMDFRTGTYVGTNAAALTATTGTIKITSLGLQVVTGDLITTADAALLAALNSATTVIRAKVKVTDVAGASSNGIFLAKNTGTSVLSMRLRGSPNQSGVSAGHGPAAGPIALASTAAGVAADGVSFVMASRHRTLSASVSGNGGTIVSSTPTGKSSTIDAAFFGNSEGNIVLNGYIERLTVWTDDPSDATLLARAV